MTFEERLLVKLSTRDKSLIRMINLPATMAGSLKKKSLAITRWLFSDPKEFCHRLKILLQQQQAGINFILNGEEVFVVADKLKEYKCKSTKQPRILIFKGFGQMEAME